MLPKFFLFNRQDKRPPIDVLIFDESGKITVEMGAATLALCDRAVIIGDCLQLEPYWDVPPHIDRANLHTSGVAKNVDEGTWNKFSERGLLASNGSLMKLALHSAQKVEKGS